MRNLLNKFRILVNKQFNLIHGYDWKYLIILDACRYDYFIEHWLYDDVLKVESSASNTSNWLFNTFPDYYDYDVYSCNPFIGDKIFKKWKYNSFEHFRKVYCLWRDLWNNRYSTVLPNDVYQYCIRRAVPKSIIWFLQPHSPYMDLNINKKPNDFRTWNNSLNPVDWSSNKSEYDMKELKRLYINNLKYVIPYVHKLTEHLEKPIIITSDHGELLGEQGLIGHPNIYRKELREVPMVIVE